VADYWPGVDPVVEDDMTPAQAAQLAAVAAEVAAIKAAVVDPSIKSLIDGAPHSIGEHVQATNDWAWVTRAEVTAMKAELDTLKSEVTGAVTALEAAVKAIATKLGV
jgi:hypothetical protein